MSLTWIKRNSNSSARAIRKTALRAYRGLRHRFTHLQALRTSACQLPDSYASINPSPATRWLNCYEKNSQ